MQLKERRKTLCFFFSLTSSLSFSSFFLFPSDFTAMTPLESGLYHAATDGKAVVVSSLLAYEPKINPNWTDLQRARSNSGATVVPPWD